MMVQQYDIPSLKASKDRIETGPVKFNDDWTGLHIRGDNALYFAMCLDDVLANLPEYYNPIYRGELESLVKLLSSVDERGHSVF